jgi:hypothetical protein
MADGTVNGTYDNTRTVYEGGIAMFKELLFLMTGMVLSVNSVARAQELILISNTQTWSTFDQGGFGPGDTLQILTGGNLIVTERSSLADDRHLIVEEGGTITMNARLDMNSRGQITMNGGEFHNTVDFKFPDSSGNQDVHIWLYGGLMVCAQIESIMDRGSILHVGGGVLRVGNTLAGGRYDPENTDEWAIVPIPPYDEIMIMDIGGGWKEISATSPWAVMECWPANGATDVVRNVVLGWTPAEFASAHNVYLGTVFDDVNNADITDPLGVLVAQGLETNTFVPDDLLEYGQTYYWRVDEVDDANPARPWKGMVWSFTVESLSYPISAERITVTASSYQQDQSPDKTIDGSGLLDDLHSTVLTDMWLSEPGESGSAWIRYEFDKVYQMHEMFVWNYNGESFLLALGLKDVSLEHSIDGMTWTPVENVTQFAQASGLNDYAHNTTVVLGDIPVKYVKITANSNWGGGGFFNQYGLSEVRFMHIPVFAREPDPEDGASGVDIDVILGWRAGREAAEHNLYISTDQQAVRDGTAPVVTASQTGYGPLSLDLGSTYYWRVDEVNHTKTAPIWEGDTWSFTTSEYLVVDDFESYNDITAGQEGSNLVYATWVDGYENPSMNGSTMGYTTGSSMETTTVHGGRQSVPVLYDNSVASMSEVTVNPAALAIGSDWTKGGAGVLSLWFYGDPNNAVTEQMYVKLNDMKKFYDGDAGNIATPSWTRWDIELASFGTNLSNVTTMTIGFERTGVTGGSGMVFIDDIRLYP